MPFNGTGGFTRLYSWVNDAAANIKIRADRMDNEMNGMATGLSTCITKDGQTTVTANLPMAGFRHTGVGNAGQRNEYAAFGQVQDGKTAWAAAGGTADAITASYSVPLTALVDGQLCYVRAGAANATTTPTFSPNGLTARTIVKEGGETLLVGDIAAAGQELILRYNLANTRWELLNPAAPLVSPGIPFTPASASAPASLDFAEDTDNGANKVTLSAPSTIAADVTVTLPGTADTLVGRDTTDTLTNKTFVAPVLGAATATSINIGGGGVISTAVPKTSFTGAIAGTTIAGAGTYSTQAAHYSRFGDTVTVRIALAWSAHTGTGNMIVTGLPFAVDTFTSFACVANGITSPAGTSVVALASPGSANITLYSITTATNTLTALAMDTAGEIYITGSYFV